MDKLGWILIVVLLIVAVGAGMRFLPTLSQPAEEEPLLTTPMETTPPSPVPTTQLIPDTPTPINVTTTAPTHATQSQIDASWREIQLQWDLYIEKTNRLFSGEIGDDDITVYRYVIVPDAKEALMEIQSTLGAISCSDPKLLEKKENLQTISAYKLLVLDASAAYYHALQLASNDREKALAEYRNAKYAYQDALGIINSFDEDSPYYPYLSRDEKELSRNIDSIEWEMEDL